MDSKISQSAQSQISSFVKGMGKMSPDILWFSGYPKPTTRPDIRWISARFQNLAISDRYPLTSGGYPVEIWQKFDQNLGEIQWISSREEKPNQLASGWKFGRYPAALWQRVLGSVHPENRRISEGMIRTRKASNSSSDPELHISIVSVTNGLQGFNLNLNQHE